jgi:hypothetical protein
MKLNNEQIFHLINLLEMDIIDTPNKRLLSENQKNKAIKYNEKLIKKLKKIKKENG